jgi:hypothetical protein
MDKEQALKIALTMRDQNQPYEAIAKRLGDEGYLSPKTKSVPTVAMVVYMLRIHDDSDDAPSPRQGKRKIVTLPKVIVEKVEKVVEKVEKFRSQEPTERKIQIAQEILAMKTMPLKSRAEIAAQILLS